MIELKVIGGGEIGSAHATYPFASLNVNSYKLQLTISLLGTAVFRPSDIVSLELHNSFLGLWKGIRINHKVSQYNSHIIFRPVHNAAFLIQHIQQTGFLLNQDPLPDKVEKEIACLQSSGSFPIKTNAAVAIVVIWNALCIPAIINTTGEHAVLRFPGAMLFPLTFIGLVCFSLLFVSPIRARILKSGRSFQEIKLGLIFILCIICVILLPAILLNA